MKSKKVALIIFAVVLLLLAGVFTSFYCSWFGQHLILIRTNFAYLPDWEKDDHSLALETLQKSCLTIAKQDPQKPFSRSIPQSGTFETWQKICSATNQVDKSDATGARKFFEYWFKPYRIYNNLKTKGLFTGYYLPTLKCSLAQDEHHVEPIYAIPDDWVKVDLGAFDEKLKGRTIVGRVKNHLLYRYPDRAAIIKGDIDKKAKVLAWCDDKIDVAFAHVQGSAIVQLGSSKEDFQISVPIDPIGGKEKTTKVYFPIINDTENRNMICVPPEPKQFLIGYEGSNGRSYVSIGKVLIKSHELTPQNSSMQDIRAWLMQHPEKIDTILNQNASYVFFRILKNDAPLGSQQVPLTPERSLAIDKRYLPLGVPIWLDTVIPDNTSQTFAPFRHLLIAQDTGGAIKGIIRGDVYWGSSDKAAFIAGHMKSQGAYWVLLPRDK
ncbi:Membrane-bound lytic murein transglycosylase A [Gammaproteobacteria bacterium]